MLGSKAEADTVLFTSSALSLHLTGRQGEDAFLQQAEARETRRQYEHSCKVHSHTHYTPRLVFAPLCGFILSDPEPLIGVLCSDAGGADRQLQISQQ